MRKARSYFFILVYNQIKIIRNFPDLRQAYLSLLVLALVFSIPVNTYSQTSTETIKIGLLIRDANDRTTKQAAELAMDHANSNGGYHGKKFELITKSCDGPWGVGSKRAVELIYDDQVSLIVDALDGRNAHLAEQVTAKSHVVLLSTQSSDPTLSRAYVPWYFRLIPDDRQQAEALTKNIYELEKFKNIALVSFDDYDGKKSVESIMQLVKKKNYPEPDTLISLSENELIQKIIKNPWEAIVVCGTKKNSTEIIEKFKSAKPNIKIYAFLNVFNFINDFNPTNTENIQFIRSKDCKAADLNAFEKAFITKFGKNPSPSLAYIYDGIMLGIEAIRKLGEDPEALRKDFNSLEYKGITGNIKFGKLGNRSNDWTLSN